MNAHQQSIPGPREVLGILVVHWRLWLTPAVVLGLAAALYAAASRPTWQASQALILRNEAANSETGQGKFNRTEEMKTVQETILELVKSRTVLLGALEELGPPADCADKDAWPTDRDVEELRQTVKLVPPKGAEFGATEVFYLEVRDHDRVRAVALNRTISRQLQAQFQQLRDLKAQSMIEELTKTVNLSKANRDESLASLSKTEKAVGADLAELRVLNDATSGDSAIRRTATEIESELRQARSAEQANAQLLGLLKAAAEDPGKLLATSNRLLESQPALRRLKDGLLDAQLHTAGLEGRMSAAHPLVQSSKQAEEEIGHQLHDELAIALRGVEGELHLNGERIAMLETQLAQASGRLSRLAELRASYSNQVAETTSRTRLLERAEQNLAEAHATQAGAKAASLLSCIDVPDAGVRPVSTSRAMIVLAGMAGGLLAGFGLVFLTVQPAQPRRVAEAAAVPPVAESDLVEPPTRAFSCNGNLSLKEALQKLCGSKI
jgi:uncharacterized protein involved in exopolysaccharide biosynthesis